MAVVYLLAHFDDEYFATPLIASLARPAKDQWFVYVADYATPEVAAGRLAESRAYLATLGITGPQVVHLGAGSGALDGTVHRYLPQLAARLDVELAKIGKVDSLFVTAWEGGHMDHDACAALAVRVAGGTPLEQITLYNGPNLPGRLFRAGRPLVENGPLIATRFSMADWTRFALGVRCFPSQWRSWLGLWPAMFASYLLRGFCHQSLDPARIATRPHDGPLLYERMYGISYAEVDQAIRRAWPEESPETPPT